MIEMSDVPFIIRKSMKPCAEDIYGNILIWKRGVDRSGVYVYWTFNKDLDPELTIHKSKIYYYADGTPYFIADCPWAHSRRMKLREFNIYSKEFAYLFDLPVSARRK